METEVQAAPVATTKAAPVTVDLFSFLDEDEAPKESEELETAPAVGSQMEEVTQILQETIVKVETPKPGFTDYWREYTALVNDAEDSVDKLVSSSEGRLRLRGVRVGERLSGHSMLHQTRKELIREVFSRAEREFAPEQGSLSIDRYTVDELLGENWQNVDHDVFDPDALWLALEAKYGGDYGVELGLKQLAKKLVDAFGLRRNKPERKANRLELSDSIYCEKAYNGGMELSYSSAQAVWDVHKAMSAFCSWAGDTETALRIDTRVREMMMHRDRKVVSRARFDMGGVGYVMFFKNITWEIYGELGDQFQAFIGRYGREALASNY